MKNKLFMVIAILLRCNYCFSTDNETFLMHKNNRDIAQAYYTAMADKNIYSVAQYLDDDVVFVAPLARVVGKQEFLERVKEFFAYSATLTIRVVFGSSEQGMVVFTLDYPAPIGIVEAAALLNIENGLSTSIELFYDARPFEKK